MDKIVDDAREAFVPLTEKQIGQIKEEASKIKDPGLRDAYIARIVTGALAHAELIRVSQAMKRIDGE